MSGTASESHRAGQEARRDTVSNSVRSGTDTRYDAMLRYLRGLYVRSPKTQQTPGVSKAPSQPPVKSSEQPVEPTDSNAEPPAE